jgi:hypothetical protein
MPPLGPPPQPLKPPEPQPPLPLPPAPPPLAPLMVAPLPPLPPLAPPWPLNACADCVPVPIPIPILPIVAMASRRTIAIIFVLFNAFISYLYFDTIFFQYYHSEENRRIIVFKK